MNDDTLRDLVSLMEMIDLTDAERRRAASGADLTDTVPGKE